MSAVAVLTCRSNSFPFQERHVTLSEGQKIGRSVARARPGPNNGIFDCKVLSRNHALLWFEEGKFFLQDTKSSNGTFVNNERLSKGSEESTPREIYSGDIIQFGVDVMESNRRGEKVKISKGSEESTPREIYSGDIIQFGVDVMESNRRGEKVTHACIIATATLYDENGAEAKAENYTEGQVKPGATVKSLEMYQLYQYLQEALHREKMMETKLNSLECLVKNTQEACDTGWQALIDEDRLLSRIDVLEGQLLNYSKAHSEDTLRQELTALQDDKHNYETTAKESLRRVLQEKLDAVKKCSDLELSLSNTELECSHVKEVCESSQKELQQLAEKYDEQMNEIALIKAELTEAEQKHSDEQERVESEKEELHDRLSVVLSQEAVLSAKIEALQADNDFAENQLTAIKNKLETAKEKKNNENDNDNEFSLTADDINLDDLIPLDIMKADDSIYEEQLKEKQREIKEFKDKIDDSEKSLEDSKGRVDQLQKELEVAELDSRQYIARIASLEEKLSLSDVRVNYMLESAVGDLELQLKESTRQNEGSETIMKTLQENIDTLKAQLDTLKDSEEEPTKLPTETTTALKASLPNETETEMSDSSFNLTTTETDVIKEELVEELAETKLKLSSVETALEQSKDDLEDSHSLVTRQSSELTNLQSDLSEAQTTCEDRSHTITELQAQLKNANNLAKDTEQQIISLKDQLQKCHLTAKQSKTDTDHLRVKLRQIKSEHEHEKNIRKRTSVDNSSGSPIHRHSLCYKSPERVSRRSFNYDKHTPSKSQGELTTLKEECDKLKGTIHTLETEMKTSKEENVQIQANYTKLQQAHTDLEMTSSQLLEKDVSTQDTLSFVQSEADTSRVELDDAKLEVSQMEERISLYESQVEEMRGEIGDMQGNYRNVADHSRLVKEMRGEIGDMQSNYRNVTDHSRLISMCSTIPLLILMFATLLALYPVLETITATSL